MKAETKNCQNCKKDFIIEPEDFLFYEKMAVPPPTFCPECRMQRRLAFRNTHSLYKRKDSFTGKDILSIYSPDKNLVVIDQKDWWGDSWDPFDYSKEYDFTKSFFTQWKELRDVFPLQSLSNSKAVNSEYCNVAEESTDCYLCTACFRNERTMYSDSITYCRDSLDLHIVHESEFSYDDIVCTKSNRLFYSLNSHNCIDSYFLFDCRNCTDCFMSSNLRNKSYYFYNTQLTKDEYAKKIADLSLGSYLQIEKLKKEFLDLHTSAIHRFAHITNSVDVTGNNIDHAKNSKYCFETVHGPEDSKYIFWGAMNSKDCYDVSAVADMSLAYETFDAGVGGQRYLFDSVVYSSSNTEYCFNCYNSSDLFGCFGLRSKQYCIFNNQYSKKEYFELISQIKKQMCEIPYIDTAGRIYTYGEFFPIELSPFCYNETVAQDYFPLTQTEANEKCFAWKESEQRTYLPTVEAKDLPDDIIDVDESILQQVVHCAHEGQCGERCSTAFKIVKDELTFYKRFRIPLPRLCYGCRHAERFKIRNPLKLWHRQCMCDLEEHHHSGGCSNEFETSYAPSRPERIFCETCYQKEIV